eukprot:TRINITY_DN510751_c0_g1_i1.p1 TRINITY_DN510751_c0_g1~~TRINITY_DN510751_c0_g1_i1.p1  ORF type:complete len:286 (+),score=56.78 TRINITY_DN510751_c0_g1_i1:26-859(+)
MGSTETIESVQSKIDELKALEHACFRNAMVLIEESERTTNDQKILILKQRIESIHRDIEDFKSQIRMYLAKRDELQNEQSLISSKTFGADSDFGITLMTIGSIAVGKTCLLERFTPIQNLGPTIGLTFTAETIHFGDNIVKIQIWDTAGHERFLSIIDEHFRNADGFLLVYNIGDRKSFDDISRLWFKLIRTKARNANVILVGNKSDLDENKRVVSYEEGEKLASELKLPFIETSAKTNHNVDKMFHLLASAVINRVKVTQKTPKKRKKRAMRCSLL